MVKCRKLLVGMIAALMLPVAAVAGCVTVQPPAGTTPSAEPSACRSVATGRRSLTRIELSASFWGGATNNFQVAVGRHKTAAAAGCQKGNGTDGKEYSHIVRSHMI